MLDGMKCVAPVTDAGRGGGKVEDGFQALVLEIDAYNAPEGRVRFQMEFEGVMEMRGIEEGVERVMTMVFEGSFMETMSSERDVDR